MENASDDFPQQQKLENILPNFAESSPPISPKTSPTSLWKSLVLMFQAWSFATFTRKRSFCVLWRTCVCALLLTVPQKGGRKRGQITFSISVTFWQPLCLGHLFAYPLLPSPLLRHGDLRSFALFCAHVACFCLGTAEDDVETCNFHDNPFANQNLRKHLSTLKMTGRGLHCTMEVIPHRPWKSKSPLFPDRFSLIEKHKQGDPRGAHEVRHGTSSINFHRAIPGSSGDTGPRAFPFSPNPSWRGGDINLSPF